MRRLLPTGLAGLAVLALLAATAPGTAVAYFTTTGSGQSAPQGIARMLAPAITAATPAGGTAVALTWSAVSPPAAGTVTYSVSRDGKGGGGSCKATTAATSCTDSDLALGTHTYVVTAKWRSWTAASASKAATVTVGPADHFVLSAASLTPTAGAADNLTIRAEDGAGNTAPAYNGSKSLVFSGAAASPNGSKPSVVSDGGSTIAFGGATTIDFSAGVATVTSSKNGLMKLYASGKADIDVSDGTISTAVPLELTVVPRNASKFALAGSTSTPTAGVPADLTITAQDTYGNTATAYTGSYDLTFSGASAAPDKTAPTVASSGGVDVAFGSATAIDFSAGIAASSGGENGTVKLYKSGATNVKATAGSIKTPNALALPVTPAPALEFLLASSASNLKAAASANLTTTALDAYGNTDTNYTGPHSLTYGGALAAPDGTAPTVVSSEGTATAFGSATPIDFSAGIAKVGSGKNGLTRLYRAEPASLTVSDGAISSPVPVAVAVSPSSASKLILTSLSPSAGALGSPCLFTCTVTGLGNSGTVKAKVAVADAYGNTVSSLGSGHAVKITLSGSGSVSGTPLTIPSSGAAETATTFSYASKPTGNFTDTVSAVTSRGATYASATLTASR